MSGLSLYQIDYELENLIDQETGEVLDFETFEALNIARNDKLERVALWVKQLNSFAGSVKAEIDTLQERKKKAEKKAESLKKLLDKALNGEKFETPKVEIKFSKSQSLQIDDEQAFINWAKGNDAELLTFKEPTVNKTEVKKALKNGLVFDGVAIVQNRNINVK